MDLVFTIFEDLQIDTLNLEEATECIYYADYLLEKEENPEYFIRYQLYKLKVLDRLKELRS